MSRKDLVIRGMLLFVLLTSVVTGKVINYQLDAGAIPDASDNVTAWKNGHIMNTTLNSLQPGDTFFIPNSTFHLMGGIVASKVSDVVIQVDGTLMYSDAINEWPRTADGTVLSCMHLSGFNNVTFTSSGTGTFDGKGARWWGLPYIGYLVRTENRPRLFELSDSSAILIEHLFFKDSPYWTFWAHEMNGLEVLYSIVRHNNPK